MAVRYQSTNASLGRGWKTPPRPAEEDGLKAVDRALNDVMSVAGERANREPARQYAPMKERGPVGKRIIECGEAAAQNYEKQAKELEAVTKHMIDNLLNRAVDAREKAIEQADMIDAYLLRLRMDTEFDIKRETDGERLRNSPDNHGGVADGGGVAKEPEAVGTEPQRSEHDKPHTDISPF